MYQILSSEHAGSLCFEVNEFIKLNPNYKLLGGPYSDGKFHYQAVYNNDPYINIHGTKQLLKD